MKANELRLGNLVNVTRSFNTSKKITIVKEVNLHYLKMALQWNEPPYIEPICITEEWLLNLGFERVESAIYDLELMIQKNDFSGVSEYRIYADSGTDNETFEFTIQIVSQEGDFLNTPIKYVDQLQNLYYALTGNELTIKL